jgi:hypothetical protein
MTGAELAKKLEPFHLGSTVFVDILARALAEERNRARSEIFGILAGGDRWDAIEFIEEVEQTTPDLSELKTPEREN